MDTKIKPTEAQIGTIYSWLRWVVRIDVARYACKYLEEKVSRRDVSLEMKRLKELKDKRALDETNVFDSPVWAEFVR